jgi:hypothetical protein
MWLFKTAQENDLSRKPAVYKYKVSDRDTAFFSLKIASLPF